MSSAGSPAGATALGYGAVAVGTAAVAVGNGSRATNSTASAFGGSARATVANATALGNRANASVASGVALGAGSVASTLAGAVGYLPVNATGAQATAIANTNSVTLGAVSVGTGAAGGNRQIVNVAAGTNDADAVNVSQLKAVSSAVAAIDFPIRSGSTAPYTTTATGVGALAVGANANATTGSTIVGEGATDNSVNNSTVLGNGASIASGMSGSNVALGKGSSVSVPFASIQSSDPITDSKGGSQTYTGFAGFSNVVGVISVGSGSGTRQITNVAPGAITAASTDAINGSQLYAVAKSLGDQIATVKTTPGPTGAAGATGATGAPGVAGTNGSTGNTGATGTTGAAGTTGATGSTGAAGATGVAGATGSSGTAGLNGTNGRTTNGTNGTNGTTGSKGDTGSVGATGASGAAGTNGANGANGAAGSAASTQGVVVYSTKSDGTINYNSVSLNPAGTGSATISNVANGVKAGDAVNVTQLTAASTRWATGNPTTYVAPVAAGANSTAIGSGAIANGANSISIGANSADGGRTGVMAIGSAGAERQIVNVAAGTQGTDAVNVDQLSASAASSVQQATTYTDSKISGIQNSLSSLQTQVNANARNADAGISAAIATANMPQPSEPGKSMMSAGVGSYGGEAGLSIGYSQRTDSGKWIFKASVNVNTRSKAGVGGGAGYQW